VNSRVSEQSYKQAIKPSQELATNACGTWQCNTQSFSKTIDRTICWVLSFPLFFFEGSLWRRGLSWTHDCLTSCLAAKTDKAYSNVILCAVREYARSFPRLLDPIADSPSVARSESHWHKIMKLEKIIFCACRRQHRPPPSARSQAQIIFISPPVVQSPFTLLLLRQWSLSPGSISTFRVHRSHARERHG